MRCVAPPAPSAVPGFAMISRRCRSGCRLSACSGWCWRCRECCCLQWRGLGAWLPAAPNGDGGPSAVAGAWAPALPRRIEPSFVCASLLLRLAAAKSSDVLLSSPIATLAARDRLAPAPLPALGARHTSLPKAPTRSPFESRTYGAKSGGGRLSAVWGPWPRQGGRWRRYCTLSRSPLGDLMVAHCIAAPALSWITGIIAYVAF